MTKLMTTICDLLEKGEDLVLCTVLSHRGSTPRTAGTKMIVRSDGRIIATVGGGCVEGDVMMTAAEVFESRSALIKSFDLTGVNVDGMDLVCGGQLDILVEYLTADADTVAVFRGLAEAQRDGKKCYLAADLGLVNDPPSKVNRCLIREGRATLGNMVPPPQLMETLAGWTGKERYPVLLTFGDRNYVVEPSYVPGTVYLFGAGHVSQQVAPLANLVDFHTVVLDDRAEFANRSRFPGADEVRSVRSFQNCFSDLDIDENSYVVIVTRGHVHDKTVLEQALKTNARYIGMIGSRHKTKKIFNELLAQGFSDADLERVYSPIGTKIGAETPEEIGISIVGELILARFKHKS